MEKYGTSFGYARAKLSRALLRGLVRPFGSWRPLETPREGYSLLIAAYSPLAGLLPANFDLLARQDLSGLEEVIVSFDAPATLELRRAEAELSGRLPVPLRVLYRTPGQGRMLRAINWGWVGCWLNYVEAIGACRTRFAVLHDMDAMLIDPKFLANRIGHMQRASEHGCKYLAIRWYEGNGITAQDRVGYVVNMALDVAWLRERHRPIDAFNRVGRIDNRRVEWDTLLWPQQVDRATDIVRLSGEEWVHPSQVASQHSYLRRYGHYRPNRPCNLPWVPYLLDLAGDRDILEQHLKWLTEAPTSSIPFLGGTLDLRDHLPEQTDWTAQQMFRLEQTIRGEVRPIVRRYIDALRRHERPAPELAARAASRMSATAPQPVAP